jgi:hypothetical protein
LQSVKSSFRSLVYTGRLPVNLEILTEFS